MDLYRKVRLACAEGMSQREAARHFNISRDSVRKMMAYSAPPGYRRTAPVKRPKLDAFIGIIDGWLEGDREVHRKQRHTAKRVFERLRDEHGFTGGYTIVKDYMRQRERRGREMFVPLAHPPGHAQADFGEAVVVIGGIEQKAHFFVMDLPHSDACYVRAYPGGGMGFIDAFWRAAASIEPSASALNEAKRFPLCTPDGLASLCADAGWSCDVVPIERETRFSDFEVFWEPFTRGAGPAPGYVAKLDEENRVKLKSRLRSDLGETNIVLPARAWAVKARCPHA